MAGWLTVLELGQYPLLVPTRVEDDLQLRSHRSQVSHLLGGWVERNGHDLDTVILLLLILGGGVYS